MKVEKSRENVKDIAVVICNYNKKDYVKKNIYSLERQSTDNFDVYVVDNASTDGSAEEIIREFGDKVCVIRNTFNLGGSGGFNTGIRKVMMRNYLYVVLLDNDVELKENCMETLYLDMKANPDIGMMGAKILKMDYPDTIQEFAPSINYDTMTFELNHGGEKDDGELPHLEDCDYVPACALIVQREVIEKIGYMPEENFIYYDDITWGVKCHQAGYRVVANSHAAVWHKGGASVNPTTFGSYYLNRNKFRFFMTYLSTENRELISDLQIREHTERILLDVFEGIYSCQRDGRYNMMKTRMDAFLDALEGVSGKAKEYKIRKREIPEEKFELLIKEKKRILIYINGYWENIRRILFHIYIKEQEWGKKYQVELVDCTVNDDRQILGIHVYSKPEKNEKEYDLIFHVCKHIYELKINSVDHIWIDGWRNVISDQDDFESYQLFFPMYRMFKLCFEDRVEECIKKIMKGEEHV